MPLSPFHVAIPVTDLAAARSFYTGLLGCAEGRSDANWVDFNLFGHQLVCHLVNHQDAQLPVNDVDGEQVPVPHYGLVLAWDAWEALASKLEAVGTTFIIEPGVRFPGKPGEQATFFITDPAANVLEFKALRHPENLFARFEAEEND
jgi:extradiol dioxygenase family protein